MVVFILSKSCLNIFVRVDKTVGKILLVVTSNTYFLSSDFTKYQVM